MLTHLFLNHSECMTLIMFVIFEYCTKLYKGPLMCFQSMEAALLLAMMISYCSEHTQFLLGDSEGLQEVQLGSDGPLENVRRVTRLISVSY